MGNESPQIARLRRRVDEIDRRIVRLLNERASIAVEIARAREADGRRSVRDAAREQEVLRRVTEVNTGPLPEAELVSVYRRLIAVTRRLQAETVRQSRRGRAILSPSQERSSAAERGRTRR